MIDVILLGEERNSINKNTQALSDASKEVGLEVNAEKTKYMFMSRHRTTGQKYLKKQLTIHLKIWRSSTVWERRKTDHNCIRKKEQFVHVRNACCKTTASQPGTSSEEHVCR
jgi:RecA/RadA recombinase